ncbi:MAG: 5'-3' exonuclease H3TH domain-containing protein [Candidatus Dasytiphilus stammeri]
MCNINRKNSLFLIDGTSYLYRAYYIFPTLTNSRGDPTGALYGFMNMIHRFLHRYNPTYMLVAFDAKGKTFRHELFKAYKLHRSQMPQVLCDQIEPLYELIRAMGIAIQVEAGVEADDVIGTLAKKAEKKGQIIYISTNDKDFAQLVTPNIKIMTSHNFILGPQEVFFKYGVRPDFITDLIGLMGDYSDNIPGVPGIGIKTAQKLLQNIGSLNDIFSNLDKIEKIIPYRKAKKIINSLKKHQEVAWLSRQLATIITDVKIVTNYEHMAVTEPNNEQLQALFSYYEFYNLFHWYG